ncbi:MAG: cell division protein FtsI [Streptosporangiales bacterium]|nr:cell division protein FtsI [Streptosporangiales bacterium]
MRRSKALIVLAGLVAFAVLVTGGVVLFTRTRGSPEKAAAQYLAAWERGDYAAMRALVAAPPPGFNDWHSDTYKDLGVARARFRPGAVAERDNARVVAFTATLTLRGVGDWTYQGRLRLIPHERQWRVDWSPAALHPALAKGRRLDLELSWPERAPVLAADGSRLDAPGQPGSVQQLVGIVGPASAEDLDRLKAPYRDGDQVGRTGLQQVYERQLAGRPSAVIRTVGEDDRPVRTVGRLEGKPGRQLRTTLDPGVQAAASGALQDQEKPTALVAVRPSTGEVVAVANKPGGFDRALLGRYPPGSTFKVITASALVADGVSPDDRVDCPKTTEIGGRTFRNYEDEDFGKVSFHTAFAKSCNTTFARLAAERLGGGRLEDVVRSFGFGAPLKPGLPVSAGQFPAPRDDTELAAAAFGQGRVLASPLHMATVAGAIAEGTWRPPVLVPDAPAADGRSGDRTKARDLEPEVVKALRSLMPTVVSEGTAAGADFPSNVAGKTGTAEYGSAEGGKDPPTHAWFIGYRDDLAFAVVVEGGGVGGEVAAPIAADFLRGL